MRKDEAATRQVMSRGQTAVLSLKTLIQGLLETCERFEAGNKERRKGPIY